jgi:hypothetical protein
MTFKKLKIKKYELNCTKCDIAIKVRSSYDLKKHSGLCISCSQKKKPYQHMYVNMLKCAKHQNREVGLTYEDYLTFVEKPCYYCGAEIKWKEHSSSKEQRTGSYFIDRKDSNIGYVYDNCVQCCTRCNRGKSNQFSSSEWEQMCSTLKYENQIPKWKKELNWDEVW